MNIYESLGAKKESWTDNVPSPCVAGDGSAGDETKMWALKQLGFVDCEAYTFHSWCETKDRTNISPFSVKVGSAEYFMWPIPSKPGEFNLSIGSMNGETVYVKGTFKPSEMPKALRLAKKTANDLLKLLPTGATQYPNMDTRYVLDAEGWKYLGHPATLASVHISGFGHYLVPYDQTGMIRQ